VGIANACEARCRAHGVSVRSEGRVAKWNVTRIVCASHCFYQRQARCVWPNSPIRLRRPPTIDGVDADEFIRHNADPIWLQQHGEHEILHQREMEEAERQAPPAPGTRRSRDFGDADGIPF